MKASAERVETSGEGGRPTSRGISLLDEVKRDILSARLRPGEKLRVQMLRDRYACGASPIREVLNQLASEGLVTRIDRRGFFVADVSQAQFDDILQNRCLMEGEALRRSISQGGADWEESVVVSHYRLGKLRRTEPAGEGGVASEWERAHAAFHTALIGACGSPILLDICRRLYDLNIRYRYLSGMRSVSRRNVAAEHERILTLTLARDAEAAVAALHEHYRMTGRFLFADMPEEGAEPATDR